MSRGGGHHSPLGAYNAVRDMVLVLDVARCELSQQCHSFCSACSGVSLLLGLLLSAGRSCYVHCLGLSDHLCYLWQLSPCMSRGGLREGCIKTHSWPGRHPWRLQS